MSKVAVKAIAVTQENNSVISNNTINSFVRFLDVSPATVQNYSSGLKQFFMFLRIKDIKQPDRNSIVEFKKYLTENNCKNSSIATYLTAIRRFFSWLESNGLYSNITIGIKSPRQDKGFKRDAFSGSQVKDIMQGINTSSIEGLRNFAILGLMATTGLRTIEVVRANIEDIRLNSGVAVLYVMGKGKSSKADFVKLPEKVLAAIRRYLQARGAVKANEPLFAGCSRRNKGGRLTTRTISSICKKAMTRAGFVSTRLTAHSLRHSSATLALMAGQSLQEVQMFMRHSNINTTLVYSHNISRLHSQCESKIADLIF